MTDEQLNILWHDTGGSIYLIGQFLNSAALWEIFGAFLGFLVMASLITAIILRPTRMLGFRLRD